MKIEDVSARRVTVFEDGLKRQPERSAENPQVSREKTDPAAVVRSKDETATAQPDAEQLEKAIDALKERLGDNGAGFTFAVESSDHSINVTVMTKDSERVLMRIPAEGIVRLAMEGSDAVGGLLNKSY
ncbi:flagellar protein FlaG [Oleidesulfovibrio sp.]|uniref:flagellar protein FlaG n=1 Tax=Oleidesulfovibrio sp. TaxID=2909707 RepID=UPI003A847AA4